MKNLQELLDKTMSAYAQKRARAKADKMIKQYKSNLLAICMVVDSVEPSGIVTNIKFSKNSIK